MLEADRFWLRKSLFRPFFAAICSNFTTKRSRNPVLLLCYLRAIQRYLHLMFTCSQDEDRHPHPVNTGRDRTRVQARFLPSPNLRTVVRFQPSMSAAMPQGCHIVRVASLASLASLKPSECGRTRRLDSNREKFGAAVTICASIAPMSFGKSCVSRYAAPGVVDEVQPNPVACARLFAVQANALPAGRGHAVEAIGYRTLDRKLWNR